MGYIEVIPFEKLNKTIDLFDMMKPQYSSIIDEKFVDIWYKIAWREKKFMKGNRSDSESVFYIVESITESNGVEK